MPTAITCLAGALNVCTLKGDTIGSPNSPGIKFTVEQDGLPMDLTGATILVDVKKTKKSATVKLQFASGSADVDDSDLVNGVFVLHKTAAQMAAVASFTDYYYDIEITMADTTRFTFVTGLWTNNQDVSG